MAETLHDSPEKQPKNKLTKKGENVVLGTVAFGLAAGAIIGINGALEASAVEQAEKEAAMPLDTSIVSIDLSENARLRSEFHTGSANNLTLVNELDERTTIDTPDGVRVLKNTTNGTWYGFEAHQLPNFDESNEEIIWVNEQGVASIERVEDEG